MHHLFPSFLYDNLFKYATWQRRVELWFLVFLIKIILGLRLSYHFSTDKCWEDFDFCLEDSSQFNNFWQIRVLAFLTFDKSLTFDNSQDNSALSSFLKIITYSDDIQLAAVNFHENWGGFVPNCVQSEIRENSSRS